jgi:5,10-methylenetetrahydromethanopterin reductase
MGSDGSKVGLVLGSAMPPEQLLPAAIEADRRGLDELWFTEDCFFTGGISAAAAALAATRRIQVGLGVVSAMLRHPALLAMEIATMERAFPGRVVAGIGLGVPAWLRQVGLAPRSPVRAMTECVTAVRELVAGERLDRSGEEFSFADVALTHPVAGHLPIHLGVCGPRMLRLSGEIADGTILSAGAGVRYLTWAREQIDKGRAMARRSDAHRVTAFALYAVDEDRRRAREEVRKHLALYMAAGGVDAISDAEGISDALAAMLRRGGADLVARQMPESWIDELSVCGTPEDCVRRIAMFYEAGAESVALFPVQAERVRQIVRMTAEQVIPSLREPGAAGLARRARRSRY